MVAIPAGFEMTSKWLSSNRIELESKINLSALFKSIVTNQTNNKLFKKLILASSSPRRKELLSEHGYTFDVIKPEESAEDGICSGERPAEYVARLAYQKAQCVAKKVDDGLILGCDTIAEVQGQILEKPVNEDHAREMLRMLSGKKHRVISGICLVDKSHQKSRTDVVVTELEMDALTDPMLEAYLETDLWIGKAGAFGLQDGVEWVRVVSGSESNVVGLPMERLAEMMIEFQDLE